MFGVTTVPPAKVAVTDTAAAIETVHVVPVPLHAPPQPENVWPAPGVSVSVTDGVDELRVTLTEQPEPPALVQLMPPPVTVPVPETVTLSATESWPVPVTVNVGAPPVAALAVMVMLLLPYVLGANTTS